MAKIVQLLNQGNEAYPRTLDACVLVSGTTLLSEKISEIDGNISGFKDGTIPVGMSISAVTDSEGNNIISTYATKSAFDAHSGDTVVHVTQEDKDYWNAKADTDTTYRFEQSGNTLMVGVDSEATEAVYEPQRISEADIRALFQ